MLKKEITDRLRVLSGKFEYYNMCFKINKSEKKLNLNPEKFFYIISGTHLRKRGLFGDINAIMRYSNYALEKGYIPVVDFKNMPNNMIEENEVGKVNGWESLFEQPAGYTLKEALQSKNRIIKDCHGNGSQQNIESWEVPWDIDWNDKKSVAYWMKVHELIKIKSEILEEIDRKYVSLFSKKDKVLGVKMRGTDYTLNKPYGHPVQPPVEDVIVLTKKIKKDYNCNKIFLGCEDKEIQELFKMELGEEAVVTGEIGIKLKKKEYLYDFYAENKISHYQNNLEYLTNTVILAKCHCLIASSNSATNSIRLWGRKFGMFEYEYVYDLGLYGHENI